MGNRSYRRRPMLRARFPINDKFNRQLKIKSIVKSGIKCTDSNNWDANLWDLQRGGPQDSLIRKKISKFRTLWFPNKYCDNRVCLFCCQRLQCCKTANKSKSGGVPPRLTTGKIMNAQLPTFQLHIMKEVKSLVF